MSTVPIGSVPERPAGGSREGGVTRIELLTAMAVAGVVGMFVVPALNVFAANAALRGTACDLMAALALARSAAVKHMDEVVVWHSTGSCPRTGTPITTTALTCSCAVAASPAAEPAYWRTPTRRPTSSSVPMAPW
jgi:Tfp pilus assembly protein FimT